MTNIKQFQIGEALVTYSRIPACLVLMTSIISEDFNCHFSTYYESEIRLRIAYESRNKKIAKQLFLNAVNMVA